MSIIKSNAYLCPLFWSVISQSCVLISGTLIQKNISWSNIAKCYTWLTTKTLNITIIIIKPSSALTELIQISPLSMAVDGSNDSKLHYVHF